MDEKNQQPQINDAMLLPQDGNHLKTKAGGVLFILGGLIFGYMFILQPIQEAQSTGSLHYFVKGIMLPPVCIYVGLMMLLFNIRDEHVRKLDAKGKPTFTAKGWWLVGGCIATIIATYVVWGWYIHTIGFDVF
jgi:hypothetical protein